MHACVGACGSAYLCAGTLHVSFVRALRAAAAAAAAAVSYRLYLKRPFQLSSSRLVADTIHQQSHGKFVCITTFYACADIAHVCTAYSIDMICMRVWRCMQVCAFLCSWCSVFHPVWFLRLLLWKLSSLL